MRLLNRFRDRRDAGRQLGQALGQYRNRTDVVVIALPRGGVPVGYEVAKSLGCPLDIIVVRKLGVPGQEELAMGAIASGGVLKLNKEVLELMHIAPQEVEEVKQRAQRELERRERAYRADRQPLDVYDRVVILVDDGLATGTSIRAAVWALRQLRAKRIVAAIPVGAVQSCERIQSHVDELVCLIESEDLIAISMWYDDFRQTTDAEVQDLLDEAVSHPLAW